MFFNEFIMVPVVVGIIFFSLVSIFRIITDYQLRRKMIQMGHVDRESVAILQKQRSSRMDSLKWGLIILFTGIGFIILSFPGIDLESPLPFGIMGVSIAVGFLTYFGISKRMAETEDKKSDRVTV